MEKKEKKADLEQLLNSLIEKGWKPRGIPHLRNAYYTTKYVSFSKRTIFGLTFYEKSIRALVAKESGLWQFVCENKMEKKMEKNHRGIWINSWAKSAYQSYPVYTMERYEYRVIESSLKDESELENFLLNSIKLD